MNHKTGKLIRKYAKATKKSKHEVRNEWLSTPRPKREVLRAKMKAQIA